MTMRAEGSAGGATPDEAGESRPVARGRLRSVAAIVAGILVLLALTVPQNLVALLDQGRTDPVSRFALEAARSLESTMRIIGVPQVYDGLRERFQRLRQ
jgi:hypothetical protein